jgi:hypothetical protein
VLRIVAGFVARPAKGGAHPLKSEENWRAQRAGHSAYNIVYRQFLLSQKRQALLMRFALCSMLCVLRTLALNSLFFFDRLVRLG